MTDLEGQSALVATPEKALLDLIYLTPGGESPNYLRELRLQNVDLLDLDLLKKQSAVFDTPKMSKSVKNLSQLIFDAAGEFEEL